MTENPAKLADRIDQTGRQLLNAAQQLKEGVITRPELQSIGDILGTLSEVVCLYASKLNSSQGSGRHALREPPGDPQTRI